MNFSAFSIKEIRKNASTTQATGFTMPFHCKVLITSFHNNTLLHETV